MKREIVVPDLLAAMTADALFAGKPQEPPQFRRPPGSGDRFLVSAAGSSGRRVRALAVKPQASRLTLDDDWVGGWYARTRLLQAATLANVGETAASPDAADGKDKVTAKVITQVRDLS